MITSEAALNLLAAFLFFWQPLLAHMWRRTVEILSTISRSDRDFDLSSSPHSAHTLGGEGGSSFYSQHDASVSNCTMQDCRAGVCVYQHPSPDLVPAVPRERLHRRLEAQGKTSATTWQAGGRGQGAAVRSLTLPARSWAAPSQSLTRPLFTDQFYSEQNVGLIHLKNAGSSLCSVSVDV